MKIAISCHPTQGGSGVVATELAAALAKRGHKVHLVAYEEPFRLRRGNGIAFHAVNVLDYPLFRYPPHDLSLANKLANVVKEHDIDIIHAHYAVPHAVSALLAMQVVRPRQVRMVTTLHGTDITFVGSHEDFFDLTRHAMIASDAVTTVSQWLREETMRRFALPREPVVIPNFVDTQMFHAEGRAGYPGPGEPFHLVHGSNLRPVKRIADVIRVFHLVQKEVDARLTILGEGPDMGIAKELTAELRLCPRVQFLGNANNMPEELRSAHLCLLLSDYESFGLFALEGMACGAPAAATSGGGLPEVVTHNETGLLCPVGDVCCTAEEVVKLLKDRARWEAMSRATAAAAREKFGVEKVIGQYEALYAGVLKP
ncbi:MAG: N-acetyl-alpha-D-glucosaminyl L-malate synthase BshA [Planctomycetota bacterium]